MTAPPDPSPGRRLGPWDPSGGQEAWDFSITSAFRMGPALADPTAIAGVFASVHVPPHGRSVHPGRLHFQSTGPGGCGRWVVRRSFAQFWRGSRARPNGLVPQAASRLRSASHRENARAIFKRAPEQTGSHCRSLGLSVLAESELT